MCQAGAVNPGGEQHRRRAHTFCAGLPQTAPNSSHTRQARSSSRRTAWTCGCRSFAQDAHESARRDERVGAPARTGQVYAAMDAQVVDEGRHWAAGHRTDRDRRWWSAPGRGDRAIANGLNHDGIPCPSARRPERNTHSLADGWQGSAVRSIVEESRCTGCACFGRWRKHEVAAQSATHQRPPGGFPFIACTDAQDCYLRRSAVVERNLWHNWRSAKVVSLQALRSENSHLTIPVLTFRSVQGLHTSKSIVIRHSHTSLTCTAATLPLSVLMQNSAVAITWSRSMLCLSSDLSASCILQMDCDASVSPARRAIVATRSGVYKLPLFRIRSAASLSQ